MNKGTAGLPPLHQLSANHKAISLNDKVDLVRLVAEG